MTILVGYAPSTAADAALDTALDIARSTGERVVVVNAGPGGEHRTKSLVTEEQQRGVQSRLDASGVAAEFRQYARGRSTVQEMKDVAAELDPSIVVIGVRRRGGFGRFVMGSVSDELLQEIDQPVLCVKEYTQYGDRTPEAVSHVAETDPATRGLPASEPMPEHHRFTPVEDEDPTRRA
ncbi:universal stress protein [Micrococcus luteus]|uniref:universal stress protein n=1 Tax=Micrococcus luteus TaxID=1270 RepID=UPI00097F5905|nr:universal stress protein [Micrococcus luteus]MCV7527692.1 universal stress protein [Micrococcus luteus]PLA47526.1 universal stress protein [Micrococcus luteus]QAV28938.1 universal stress protein [Micrococcus luteus]SJN29370.1 UspA [Micrococcus luteus Mu201]